MRWWIPALVIFALGAAGFYQISKPIVPEPQCADRTPEELEQAVFRHMKNRTSWAFPPHPVATPFLEQHRFLRNEYGYSPDPRSWIVPFTVGEGASTSSNTMIAIVHCSGYVELSFWRPTP